MEHKDAVLIVNAINNLTRELAKSNRIAIEIDAKRTKPIVNSSNE